MDFSNTITSEQFLFKSKQKNSTQDVLVHKNKVQILGKSFLWFVRMCFQVKEKTTTG